MTKRSLRYPEWMYGGPFVRIANPDRDLPKRDPSKPVSQKEQATTEGEGIVDGERVVAPFNDANSIEETLGLLYFAETYPSGWDSDERFTYPTIQGALAQARLRLEKKIERTRSKPRVVAYEAAVASLDASREAYAEGRYESGEALLLETESHISAASRSRHRKGGKGGHGAA